MIISTVLYVAVGLVMTGLVPYTTLNVADPISRRSTDAGIRPALARRPVDMAAVIGLASTVLVTFYGQTRILMRMSSDGMLPPTVRQGQSKRFSTPVFTTMVCGVAGAIIAALMPIDVLGELVSIGTLFAFLLVAAACSCCGAPARTSSGRSGFRRSTSSRRSGSSSAVALMATLPIDTWIRLLVWLLIGLSIYFLYARRRTAAKFAELAAGERALEADDG